MKFKVYSTLTDPGILWVSDLLTIECLGCQKQGTTIEWRLDRRARNRCPHCYSPEFKSIELENFELRAEGL